MRSFRRTGAPALVATLAVALSTVPASGIATGLFTGSGPSAAVIPTTMSDGIHLA